MIEHIKSLVKHQKTCVLATSTDDKPYCSLMAYVSNEPCDEIYMVTHKNTRKYNNLIQNPHVSLMIDTRETKSRTSAQALTVQGSYCKIDNETKQKEVREQLLDAHPNLKEFMDCSDSELLCIEVRSFLLLNGLVDAHFIEIK